MPGPGVAAYLILSVILFATGAFGVLIRRSPLIVLLALEIMLRLISAILHRNPGPTITEAALDLRPAEISIIVPLVAVLLALSFWPAAITDHSFGGRPTGTVDSQFEAAP